MIKHLRSKILGVMGLIVLLTGCVQDNIAPQRETEGDITELNINIAAQNNSLSSTRAESSATGIDLSSLHVLVFEVLDNNQEVFSYKAEISKKQVNSLVIKAKTSKVGQKFRFVILTNADGQLIKDKTTKQEVLNQFTFDLAGKWSLDASNPIPMWGESASIEVDREKYLGVTLNLALAKVDLGLNFKPQTAEEQTDEVEGLPNFKLTSARVYRTKNKAYVAGSFKNMINNYVTEPNIPASAIYNLGNGTGSANIEDSNADPLLYQVDLGITPVGADKITNQIYIPESKLITDEANMENVPCLVFGGYYGEDNINSSNPKETFYRVDFAQYKNENKEIDYYKPILRNNRYVFNIKSMSTPGFPTPELALNSLPIQMNLEVQEWKINSLNQKVQGEYFFSIDSRDVLVPTVDFDGDMETPALTAKELEEMGIDDINGYVWKKVGYKTNVKSTKEVIEWESTKGKESKYFKLFIDDSYFWIGAKPNAPTLENPEKRSELEDLLTIQFMDMQMSIKIKQEALNLIYNIECGSVKVNGKYREGGTLNYTHNIELTIVSPTDLYDIGMADVPTPYTLDGQIIQVFTKKRKGISFKFQGVISDNESTTETALLEPGKTVKVRKYKLKLEGLGTPIRDPKDPNVADSPNPDHPMKPIEEFVISSNSVMGFGDGSTGSLSCKTRIIFGYKTKKILTIGSNASLRYGYVLEPNTGSRAFVDASVNFGTDPNSTVTIEQYPSDYNEASARNNAFKIKVMTRGSGMSGYSIINEDLKNNITEFKPDIILIGYAISFSDDVIAEFDKYVEAGGVLIMNTEYYPRSRTVLKMLQTMFKDPTLVGGNNNVTGSDMLFELPTGDKYENDPILNGPFGDMRGKQWGSDGHALFGLEQKELPETIVYNTVKQYGACFIRDQRERNDGSGQPRAFIFNGDGGFISNSKRYIGGQYQGSGNYCPFAIDGAYRPIPRTNFKESPGIYNSQIFGNILAWAVDYAEEHGYNVDRP